MQHQQFLIKNRQKSTDLYILAASFLGSHGNCVTCDFLSGWVPPAADSGAVESHWSDTYTGNHRHSHTQSCIALCPYFYRFCCVSAETSGVWACEDTWFSPQCCTVPAVRRVTCLQDCLFSCFSSLQSFCFFILFFGVSPLSFLRVLLPPLFSASTRPLHVSTRQMVFNTNVTLARIFPAL